METIPGISPAFSKKAFNCEVVTNDTPPKYVSATLPDDKVNSVIAGLNVITTRPMEDGVYTWILWKNYGMTRPTFAATKVAGGAFELGTAHIAIAAKMASLTVDKNRITVHGAGELKVEGGEIKFNLLSGTFIAAWTRSKRGAPPPKLCGKRDVQDYIASIFPKFVPGASYDNSMETYITQKTITRAEIEAYKSKGWSIEMFDTQEACKAAAESAQTAGRRRTYRRCRKCGLPKKPETK
jgi:hypothetical protein